MDKVLPGAIVVLVIALALTAMALAWRARRRRQSALDLEAPAPAELGDTRYSAPVAYVATTPAGSPLDRITVAGLAFRGRAHLTVGTSGVLLAVAGAPERFIAAVQVTGAGRATWTIDRVVETDGLVVLGWLLGDHPVESYFRPENEQSARALVAAINDIAPATVTEESEV